VAEAPGEAEAAAARWEAQGGGAAARHCRAMALEALGAERAAAGLLMEIAAEARALPDRARAEMVLQAGELFLRLGALDAAGRAAEEALGLTGRAPGALAFRARLGAERGDWRGALADLDAALEGRPGDPGLLVLRASAKRRLGRLVAAADDARWARELAPEDPEAWLETGTIRAARGDRPGARAAFLEAIRLAGDGPLARAARLRLQALEAGG
jgi:tetratricopeptide (TPR) repeat protein